MPWAMGGCGAGSVVAGHGIQGIEDHGLTGWKKHVILVNFHVYLIHGTWGHLLNGDGHLRVGNCTPQSWLKAGELELAENDDQRRNIIYYYIMYLI